MDMRGAPAGHRLLVGAARDPGGARGFLPAKVMDASTSGRPTASDADVARQPLGCPVSPLCVGSGRFRLRRIFQTRLEGFRLLWNELSATPGPKRRSLLHPRLRPRRRRRRCVRTLDKRTAVGCQPGISTSVRFSTRVPKSHCLWAGGKPRRGVVRLTDVGQAHGRWSCARPVDLNVCTVLQTRVYPSPTSVGRRAPEPPA